MTKGMETTLKTTICLCIAKEVTTSPLSCPEHSAQVRTYHEVCSCSTYHCSEECECEREKMVAKDKNNEADLSLMIGYFLSHLIT